MNEPVTGRPPTIVVIDDEPAIRHAMTRFFERRGWRCISIADGAAAAAVLFKVEPTCEFDVVLCDLWLPHMSGLELFHRAECERPDVADRFVLATGDARGVLVACPVLAKPFPLSEIAEMAEAILLRCKAA